MSGLALVTAGCTYAPTQVLVLVGTDAPRGRPALLRVSVAGGVAAAGDGGAVEQLWTGASPPPLGARAIALPGSFAVVPRPGVARDGRVTLIIDVEFPAVSASEPAVSFRRVTRFAFVPRTPMRLPVLLSVSCGARSTGCTTVNASACTVSVRCEEQGMTCGDQGTCVPTDPVLAPVGPEAPVFPTPDAGGPVVVALSREPYAIAADRENVYWADFAAGSVWRVPIAGGAAVALAASGDDVYALAGHNGEVYWAPRLSGIVQSVPAAGGPATLRVGAAGGVRAIAIEGDSVFFASDGDGAAGGVRRARIAGGAITDVVTSIAATTLAVRNGEAVYASATSGVVARSPISGGGGVDVVTAQEGIAQLVVDATFAYWTNHDRNVVHRVPLVGGLFEAIVSREQGPRGIAIDGDEVFWTADVSGAVLRGRFGDEPRVIAAGQDRPTGIVLVPGYVYWTNRGGTVMRAPR